ncbi:MAG: hypothetical protein XU13_C0041G0029 [Candidatus Rokubacteria bacterium CSP1-6]|nr:MAG: hypothetical protein XU13_C0041G0029 [Candidatus Rokubacteria bacterium CSP1-6]
MDITVIAVSFSVLLWLYLSSVILTAYVASESGRSGVGWFFLSFLFPPYMTLLALAALPEKKEEEWLDRAARHPTTPTIGQRLGRS